MRKYKYKVTFLSDKRNLWFENQLINYDFKKKRKYKFSFSKDYKKILNQDIVFVISYTKILPNSFLKKNKLVLVLHASKLPKNRGGAPVQYEVIKNKKKLFLTLFKPTGKIDAGNIYLIDYFLLNGTELSDEIRYKQGIGYIKIINKFINLYPNIKDKKQTGQSTYNKKRTPRDSKLDINKSIKQQFNLLRANDNNLYPSFFWFRNKKYIIKIFKSKNN